MNWREVEFIRKDPARFRDLATVLLRLAADEGLTEWEHSFLESVAKPTTRDEFSLRQAEKLIEIRDGVAIVSDYLGFSVGLLLRKCFEGRDDLPDSDIEWLTGLISREATSMRLRDARRLLRCARSLQLVDSGTSSA